MNVSTQILAVGTRYTLYTDPVSSAHNTFVGTRRNTLISDIGKYFTTLNSQHKNAVSK